MDRSTRRDTVVFHHGEASATTAGEDVRLEIEGLGVVLMAWEPAMQLAAQIDAAARAASRASVRAGRHGPKVGY